MGEDNKGKIDLSQFLYIDGDTDKVSLNDYKIVQYIKENEHIFIMGGIPYIYEKGVYRIDAAGTKLKTMIRDLLVTKYKKSPVIKRIYDLFMLDNAVWIKPEELNQFPAEWIPFRNGYYDPTSRKMISHDPKYRTTIQIPHDYEPEGTFQGDMIQNWLSFICDDEEDREMLMQFAGLCLTRDTSQQKFLILNGEGGTGKSLVIRMIDAMIGEDNISNISLHQLSQRFAAFGLLNKLLNSCADLETDALQDVSILKKVLGEDRISAEAKGKDAIMFRSFAKLIFSTNELPLIKAEKTNGFYRRLLVLTMNKVPEKKDTEFFNKLSAYMDDFIRLSVEALERLYQNRIILESKNSIEAVKKLRCESDTVEAYLEAKIIKVPDNKEARITKGSLYLDYEEYTREMDGSPLPKGEFFRSIKMKGIGEIKTGGLRYFKGIMYSENAPKNALNMTHSEYMSAEGIQIPFDL